MKMVISTKLGNKNLGLNIKRQHKLLWATAVLGMPSNQNIKKIKRIDRAISLLAYF